MRLVTNPKLFTEPPSIADAWTQVQRWLAYEAAWVPLPTATHRVVIDKCLRVSGLGHNDIADAHLAALAIEHGLQVASADSGFARFAGLTWFNPLV